MAEPQRIELPVPFPLKTVNAWLFPGDKPALVDCGIGTPDAYALLLDGIRAAGVDPGNLRLFITHGHVDHAGNARRLRDDHGVPLHAPRAEAPFVETFRADGPRRNDEFATALRAHGTDPDDVRRLREDSDAIDAFLEDVSITKHLGEGRQVLGSVEAQVIQTPGHTPGSTSFLLSEDNQLLSGDTLLEHITSNAVELRDADHGNYHTYVQTVEGLRRFVGVECLPGHRDPFELTHDVLDRHIGLHEQRRRRIVQALDKPKTARQLFPVVFPGLDGDAALFMGMAEIVGHLNAAEIDGLVVQETVDGVRRYRRR